MRELHPDAEQIVDTRREQHVPPLRSLSPDGLRDVVSRTTGPTGSAPDVADVTDYHIDGPNGDVPVRVYAPDADTPTPAVIYYHGGGWVFGDFDYVDSLCRVLADALQWTVVSVDYRLAPENPFPAPLQDAYAAATWVVDYGEAIGVDPERVVVAGDSAGGNLATAVTMMARDDPAGPTFAYQVLVYPITNFGFDTASYEAFAEGYYVSRSDMQWFWDQYLETPIDGHNAYASPLKARSLDGLPDATILTSEYDPLRDEGEAYADRLTDHSVDVHHVRFDRMVHGFVTEAPELDTAMAAVEVVSEDLKANV